VVDTTHSPYMVDASRAHRVRAVEDVEGEGTRVHEGAGAASRDTVLHTLLVGGVADLGYLEAMSGYLRDGGRRGLDPEELAGEGAIVRRVERATATALDRYRPARYLLTQQRLLPVIGREPLHRFARLFATLDEL
jgi:hypothetical protein